MNVYKLLAVIVLFCNMPTTRAQEKEGKEKKWDVNNPDGPYKEVSFSVNEGTWMNVDISPDGKEIVFIPVPAWK